MILICSTKDGGCGYVGFLNDWNNSASIVSGNEYPSDQSIVICPNCKGDFSFPLTSSTFDELTECLSSEEKEKWKKSLKDEMDLQYKRDTRSRIELGIRTILLSMGGITIDEELFQKFLDDLPFDELIVGGCFKNNISSTYYALRISIAYLPDPRITIVPILILQG